MANYKFVPVTDIAETYKRTKIYAMLDDFVASGIAMCELVQSGERKSTTQNIRAAAKRFSLPVDVISRGGKIYLIRREV